VHERINGKILIPLIVMGEAYTCAPDDRALIDHLIEEIGVDGDVFVHLILEDSRRGERAMHSLGGTW
jgi:hypothetical protein